MCEIYPPNYCWKRFSSTQKNPQRILLIDEVMCFSVGAKYNPVSSCSSPETRVLFQFIWNHRNQRPTLHQRQQLPEHNALIQSRCRPFFQPADSFDDRRCWILPRAAIWVSDSRRPTRSWFDSFGKYSYCPCGPSIPANCFVSEWKLSTPPKGRNSLGSTDRVQLFLSKRLTQKISLWKASVSSSNTSAASDQDSLEFLAEIDWLLLELIHRIFPSPQNIVL